jgi:hypothetical protein
MAFEVSFTDHAVRRFIQRHYPEMTHKEALLLLEDRAREATSLKQKTFLGDHQWQMTDPDIVLVVKHERGRSVCVTVLPTHEDYGAIPEEELEAMREYAERTEPRQIRNTESTLEDVKQKCSAELPQKCTPLQQLLIATETKLANIRLHLAKEYLEVKAKERNDELRMQRKRAQKAENRAEHLKCLLAEALRHLRKSGKPRDAEFADTIDPDSGTEESR